MVLNIDLQCSVIRMKERKLLILLRILRPKISLKIKLSLRLMILYHSMKLKIIIMIFLQKIHKY